MEPLAIVHAMSALFGLTQFRDLLSLIFVPMHITRYESWCRTDSPTSNWQFGLSFAIVNFNAENPPGCDGRRQVD